MPPKVRITKDEIITAALLEKETISIAEINDMLGLNKPVEEDIQTEVAPIITDDGEKPENDNADLG